MDKVITYFEHEEQMTRMERTNVRLWVLCILLILLLVGTNIAWLYYESQFEYYQSSVEQEIDTGEGNATVIGIGDYNGESKTDSED